MSASSNECVISEALEGVYLAEVGLEGQETEVACLSLFCSDFGSRVFVYVPAGANSCVVDGWLERSQEVPADFVVRTKSPQSPASCGFELGVSADSIQLTNPQPSRCGGLACNLRGRIDPATFMVGEKVSFGDIGEERCPRWPDDIPSATYRSGTAPTGFPHYFE